jgi:adenylate cyclase class IV
MNTYIDPIERMKKIHIWIGASSKSEDEFCAYFDEALGVSEFSKDIRIDGEYDEVFIGILYFGKKIRIEEALKKEIPISINDISKAIEVCNHLNIKDANAAFYLTDASVAISELNKRYNELNYIGIFHSSL